MLELPNLAALAVHLNAHMLDLGPECDQYPAWFRLVKWGPSQEQKENIFASRWV